jgi:hypothetical protein
MHVKPPRGAPPPRPFWFSVATCLATIVLSSWLVLHNKYVQKYVFPNSNCILLVQNIVTLTFALGARRLGLLHFTVISSWGDAFSGLLYTVNVMAGIWSLSYLSVPIFSMVKRCTVMVSWVIEVQFDRKPTTFKALPPIILMLAATIFAGSYDGQFVLVGYMLGALSCVAQGSAFELGKRVAASANKGIWAVLVANSAVAIVIQLVWLCATGEIALLHPAQLSSRSAWHLALNSVSCMALNYAIFLNCLVNSPLAHAVTGNIKSAFATAGGVFLLDKPLGLLTWVGIAGNLGGAAWFSWVKLVAGVKPSAKPKKFDQPNEVPIPTASTSVHSPFTSISQPNSPYTPALSFGVHKRGTVYSA